MYGENQYKIVLAVAGFSEEDLSIKLENGLLVIDLFREIPEEAKPHHAKSRSTVLAQGRLNPTD
ncbi:Hsp20 family protein [Halomonas eurihalina]|uniref:Hsp20 family protein n=1 Tax=Halomonas eurihalina TaxID=42566 RepID=UPI001FE516AC|nr:Hsp20 family protein [Halomonas eurihalina]MDR5860674.1 Hsp20 family protein [Halomonas eurihalina]